MDTQQITNNKLIAELVGTVKIGETLYYKVPDKVLEQEGYGLVSINRPEHLKYHCDWNWLIGAITKIKEIPLSIKISLSEIDMEKTYNELAKYITQ